MGYPVREINMGYYSSNWMTIGPVHNTNLEEKIRLYACQIQLLSTVNGLNPGVIS